MTTPGFLWGGVAGASLYALSTYAPSALLPYWATADIRRKVRAMSADARCMYFSYFGYTPGTGYTNVPG